MATLIEQSHPSVECLKENITGLVVATGATVITRPLIGIRETPSDCDEP